MAKEIRESPFVTNCFYFFVSSRFQCVAHNRYTGSLVAFYPKPPLDIIGTSCPSREKLRVAPWFVDAVFVGIAILFFGNIKQDSSFNIFNVNPTIFWRVVLSLLIFRVVLFPLRVSLHALLNVLPVFRQSKFWLFFFPGSLFRSLFVFDIIIPQNYFFPEILWGKVVAQIVFVLSSLQFVFRVFIQKHGVYLLADFFIPIGFIIFVL